MIDLPPLRVKGAVESNPMEQADDFVSSSGYDFNYFLWKEAKRNYQKNYTEKKKTPTGGTVRVYSEEWVKKRWAKKVKKLKSLETGINKLRKKYKEDLRSDDPKTRAIATLVGLMDETAIRIGNDDSADEAGTFGATTLQKKHAKVSGSTIHFKFKGKSGVDQDLTLSDKVLVSQIKKLLDGKKPGDLIFEYESGQRVSGKIVNKYLRDFGISAKDVRGFHANHLMKEKLKKTKDFEKALEETAKEVGHEAKTLKNQYLDPNLVKKYEKKDKKAFTVPLMVRFADYKSALEQAFEQVLGDTAGPVNTTWQGQNMLPQEERQRLEQANHTPEKKQQNPGSHVKSRYMHLSQISVKEGQQVHKGEILGLSGHSGNAEGAHLHVQRHVDGALVDPRSYAQEFFPKVKISSGYGERSLHGGEFHHAVDIAVPDGTPVPAWENGVISIVQYNNPKAGNWVEVSHADAQTQPIV